MKREVKKKLLPRPEGDGLSAALLLAEDSGHPELGFVPFLYRELPFLYREFAHDLHKDYCAAS